MKDADRKRASKKIWVRKSEGKNRGKEVIYK